MDVRLLFSTVSLLSATALLSAGCDDGSRLLVDLRTDVVAGEEFSGVRVRLTEAGGATVSTRDSLATFGEDYTVGRRVLELDGLANGAYVAVVELRDAAGSLVADRRTAFQIEGDFAFTSLISRDARSCDMASCGTDETCGPGQCVNVACFPEVTAACPPSPDCTSSSDCAARAACSVPICYAGVCLYATTAGSCGADEWCNPDDGCLPRTATPDGGMPIDGGVPVDGGAVPRDGGPDAGVSCPLGYAECDGNLDIPCELSVSDDVRNCGGCGVRCGTAPNGTPACRASACTVDCDPGFSDCNGDVVDGCESDPLLDAANCGICGSACPASLPVCVTGDCVANPFPSTGTEGPFEPTADMVLPAGIHNFTTVTIPAGVTIRTNGNGVLEIRATGDIRIEGIIDLSGGRGGNALIDTPSAPGGGGATGTTVAGADGVLMTCPPDGVGGTGGPGGAGGGGSCAAGGRFGGGAGSHGGSGGGGGGHAGGSGGGAAGGVGGSTSGSAGGAGSAGAGRGGEPGQGVYSGGDGESFGCCGQHAGGGGSIGLSAITDLGMVSTFRPGSAGGGGTGIDNISGRQAGGGGAGGGGALRIASATRIVIDGGTILARGGDGGVGDAYTGGGGAGSGGAIYLAAPEMDLMASMSVTGGVGRGGQMGGAGGLGRIRLSVVPERCTMGLTSTPPVMAGCTETSTSGYVYIGRYPD